MRTSKPQFSAPASSAAFTWKAFDGWATCSSTPSVNRRSRKPTKLADEFGVEKTEADYRKILDDPAVDAVHICTPNFCTLRLRRTPCRPAST